MSGRRSGEQLQPSDWLSRQLRDEIVIHTADDQTYRGLLDGVYPDGLVLRMAKLIDGQSEVGLPGEVFIPREKVAIIQHV